ncbi:MAG: hypothetical protein ABSG19_02310 [Candidatus Aminicenantales bacterium]
MDAVARIRGGPEAAEWIEEGGIRLGNENRLGQSQVGQVRRRRGSEDEEFGRVEDGGHQGLRGDIRGPGKTETGHRHNQKSQDSFGHLSGSFPGIHVFLLRKKGATALIIM